MLRPIIVDPADNVATAIAEIAEGTEFEIETANGPIAIRVLDSIPYGHKLALSPLAGGEPVIKYGATIGVATRDIPRGGHVHTQNLTSLRIRGDRGEKDEA